MKTEPIFKDRDDVEIDLRDIFYAVFKHWRMLLKTALLFVAVTAVFYTMVSIIRLNDEDYISDAKQSYDLEATIYNSLGNTIQKDIRSLKTNLTEKETYIDNSILMRIDPYNKVIATVIYYIDTGYQIIPGSTYQNIDYSDRIISLYMFYLTNGELYMELLDQIPELTKIQYTKEILDVSVDYSTDMITISIINTSTDECQKILEIIKAGMQDIYLRATSQISEHTLTKISENIYTIVDFNLETLQNANIQAVSDMADDLDSKSDELEDWGKTKEPTWEYTPWEVTKSVIKYSIIAAVLGVLFGAIWIVIQSVTADTIRNPENLKSTLTLRLLGSIPSTVKHDTAFDKLAYSVGNIKTKRVNHDRIIAITARSIMRVARAEGIGDSKFAIMGSISTKDLVLLTDSFNKSVPGDDNRFILAGNPMIDELAIEDVENANCVIIVEKQDQSSYRDIVRECNRINSWDIKILGIVLLDVDAV